MNTSRVGFFDFIIVLLYGTALAYTHNFIYPLTTTQQWMGSGILALSLGAFGPALEEVLEWMIAFGVGVVVALLSPQILQYYKTGTYHWRSILEATLHGIPFTLNLLAPWLICLPIGILYYKFTHRNYYRHARFF